MLKLLIIILLVALISYVLWPKIKLWHQIYQTLRNLAKSKNSRQPAHVQKLVACAYCQVQVPVKNTISVMNANATVYYCSHQHYQAALAKLP